MAASCASCGRAVPHNHENRLPPWCPHCGGNVQAKAVVERALVGTSAGAVQSGGSDPPSRAWEERTAASHASQPVRSEEVGPLPQLDELGEPEQVYRGSG